MDKYSMCIGAQKAGTTLLFDLLSEHPELDVPKYDVKEVRYLLKNSNTKDEYDKNFHNNGLLKFEASPGYMFLDGNLKMFTDILGKDKLKIIAILRDPINRAESNYYMNIMNGFETKSFRECFEQEATRIKKGNYEYMNFSYFKRGLYADQLDVIYSLMDEENVKIIIFEDFIRNQQKYADEVCDFLGISKFTVMDKHSNKAGDSKNKILAKSIRYVTEHTPRFLKIGPLKKLKRFLKNKNRTELVKEKIEENLLKELKEYFREDVKILEDKYQLDTSLWKDYQQRSYNVQ